MDLADVKAYLYFLCLGFICAVVMHGSILLVTSPPPPRATPRTSPALLARGWGIVRRGPVPGVGGWGK